MPIHTPSHVAVSIVTAMCYMVFSNIQTLDMTVINEVVTAPSSNWQRSNSIQYIVCCLLHSAIYCTSVLWLAVFLFKRKEIA